MLKNYIWLYGRTLGSYFTVELEVTTNSKYNQQGVKGTEYNLQGLKELSTINRGVKELSTINSGLKRTEYNLQGFNGAEYNQQGDEKDCPCYFKGPFP